MFWYHKLKSPTAVQRKFRNEFGQHPPHTNSIKRWFKNFMETGSILVCIRSGRPSIDEREREREREICLFASNLFNKLLLKTQKKKQ